MTIHSKEDVVNTIVEHTIIESKSFAETVKAYAAVGRRASARTSITSMT